MGPGKNVTGCENVALDDVVEECGMCQLPAPMIGGSVGKKDAG